MAISLTTWAHQTVTPKDDAIIQDACAGRSGILYGCAVTVSGNALSISPGYGIVKGRLFEVTATNINVSLPASGTTSGTLYIKLDLSNTSAPISFATASGSFTPTQDENANFSGGIYEMVLATYTLTTSGITGLTIHESKVPYNRSPVYQSLADLGLSAAVPGYIVVGRMADRSIALLTASDITDPPYTNAQGNLIIIKGDSTHVKRIFLSSGNNPDYVYDDHFWEKMPYYKDMYYATNSRTTLRLSTAGYITSGGTQIVVSAPTNKRLKSGRKLSLLYKEGGIVVRQNGKYLLGTGSSQHDFETDVSVTFNVYENEIILYINRDSGFGGVNNGVVGVDGSIVVYEN